MNEEQKKLVEENHNLIYKFINDKHLKDDEFYDLLAIALCKAAIFYNSDLNINFSTYAYECMKNEYLNYKRYLNSNCRIPLDFLVSFDAILEDDEGYKYERSYYIEDRLQSPNEFDDTYDDVEKFIRSSLTNTQSNILRGLMEGYSEVYLAKYFKCTKQNISLIKKNIIKKYLKFKGDNIL